GYMIDKSPVKTHTLAAGSVTEWGQTGITLASTPDFRSTRDGTAGYTWGDYPISGTSDNRGVGQVCHTTTANFTTTLYTATHNNTSGRCTGTGCHEPNQTPTPNA